jgi:hypothetical protein
MIVAKSKGAAFPNVDRARRCSQETIGDADGAIEAGAANGLGGGRLSARSVDPALELDDLLPDLVHGVPHEQLVARSEGHYRVGCSLERLDEVRIDHDGLIVEPS